MAKKLNAVGASKSDRFVRLDFGMLNSQAWAHLSPVAKAVLIEIGKRHNGINNGEISLSTREAAEAVRVSKDTAATALRLLIDLGFLRLMSESSFNGEHSRARVWAITAEKAFGQRATRDFANWRPSPSISQTLPENSERPSDKTDSLSPLPDKRPKSVRPQGHKRPQTPSSPSDETDTSNLPSQGGETVLTRTNANGPCDPSFFDAVKAKASADGLSIAALAARCRVSRPQLSNALAGRTKLNPAAMALLRDWTLSKTESAAR